MKNHRKQIISVPAFYPVGFALLMLTVFGAVSAVAQQPFSKLPDLSIKLLRFGTPVKSSDLPVVILEPVLQKSAGSKINSCQIVSIRSLDGSGNAVISCDVNVPAWTDTTGGNAVEKYVSSCFVDAETFKRIRKIYVTADAGGQISEADEKNNRLELTAPFSTGPMLFAGGISQNSLPDLKIQSWEFSPDFSKLTVTVENACAGSANNFYTAVSFHADKETSQKVFTFGQKTADTGGNSTTKIVLDVVAFTNRHDVRGKNFINVTVDPFNTVKESDKNNNYLKMGADKKLIAPSARRFGVNKSTHGEIYTEMILSKTRGEK